LLQGVVERVQRNLYDGEEAPKDEEEVIAAHGPRGAESSNAYSSMGVTPRKVRINKLGLMRRSVPVVIQDLSRQDEAT